MRSTGGAGGAAGGAEGDAGASDVATPSPGALSLPQATALSVVPATAAVRRNDLREIRACFAWGSGTGAFLSGDRSTALRVLLRLTSSDFCNVREAIRYLHDSVHPPTDLPLGRPHNRAAYTDPRCAPHEGKALPSRPRARPLGAALNFRLHEGATALPTLTSSPVPTRPSGITGVVGAAKVAATVGRGFSQIFFAESAIAGECVLAAMALASPRAAVLALLGCATQTVTATAPWWRSRLPEIHTGLMGFNGALVGAAAALYTSPSFLWAAVLATVGGSALCIPVHLLFSRCFERPGLPVSTGLFCLVASLGVALCTVCFHLAPPAPVSASPSFPGPVASGWGNAFAEVVLVDGALSGLVIAAGLAVASVRIAGWGAAGGGLAVLVALAFPRFHRCQAAPLRRFPRACRRTPQSWWPSPWAVWSCRAPVFGTAS